MTAMTKQDAINAAASVATDVAEGRLDPADLERQAVAELTELVGTVTGPDDPLWELQVKVARGVLAAGGIGHLELSEWAAVGRRRENPDAASATEAVAAVALPEPPEAPVVLTEADTVATEPYIAEPEPVDPADADPEPTDPSPADSAGCGCRTAAPRDRRVLAVGRGLPTDNGLRPL